LENHFSHQRFNASTSRPFGRIVSQKKEPHDETHHAAL